MECRWPRAAGVAQPRRLAPHLAAGRHLRPRVKTPLPLCWGTPTRRCLASSLRLVAACRFQEIVPLNAGNVLGAEDNGPARKWVSLVRRTLNSLPGSGGSGSLQTPSPAPYLVAEMDADFERSTRNDPSFFHRRSFQSGLSRSMRVDGDILADPGPARLERRYSVNDRVMYGSRPSDYEANCRWGGGGGGQSDDEDDHVGGGESPITVFSPMSHGYGNAQPMEECSGSARGPARYLPLHYSHQFAYAFFSSSVVHWKMQFCFTLSNLLKSCNKTYMKLSCFLSVKI